MLKLFEIHLSKANNLMSARNMNIEFFASKHRRRMQYQKQLLLNSIKIYMKAFITAAVSKMMEKSPIGSVAVINASALEPQVIQI